MYWELLLTDEEYQTIYTAVKMEFAMVSDPNAIKLLSDALNVLRQAEKGNSSERV